MVVVIIDFDNYFGTDVALLTIENFELALTDIVVECEKKFKNFQRINIRLYGGWFHDTTFTKQASSIQLLLSQIQIFPKVKNGKVINGDVELVSSLYEIPNHKWQYTYKEKSGIPRIRINHDIIDDMCNNNRNLCPKYLIYKFTSKKQKQCHVSGCTHLHKNIFKGIEQKMIDTMIACDVISTVNDESIKGVFILSDDQDHFPSYALASNNCKQQDKIVIGMKNNNVERFNFATSMLSVFNIEITLMP